jgi:predicted TIM-barrel fold metal-dependent hydrolase
MALPQSFEVFDCHQHVGRSNLDATVGGVAGGDLESERERRLALMDRDGIAQAAVLPFHAYERPRGLADTRAVNDAIAAYRDACPGRFPVAIGVVEPLHGAASLEELDRCRDELGLAGISFHARFQGVDSDHPWIIRYVERMLELDLLPILHAVPESEAEALWQIMSVARSFPDSEMLVLDAFAGFSSSRQALVVADICPMLRFDTSLARGAGYVAEFVRRHGADRVLFGTDLYSTGENRHLLAEMREFDLPEHEHRLILGGNARRLYARSRDTAAVTAR